MECVLLLSLVYSVYHLWYNVHHLLYCLVRYQSPTRSFLNSLAVVQEFLALPEMPMTTVGDTDTASGLSIHKSGLEV